MKVFTGNFTDGFKPGYLYSDVINSLLELPTESPIK
jgi:hypothetical protein